MPRSQKPVAKSAAKPAAKRTARGGAAAKSALGALPEWNLADLYGGLDDPAIGRDLDRTDSECAAFEAAYRGKLAEMAASPTAGDRKSVV